MFRKCKLKVAGKDEEWNPPTKPKKITSEDSVQSIVVESLNSERKLQLDPYFGVRLEISFNPPGSTISEQQRRGGRPNAGASSAGARSSSGDGSTSQQEDRQQLPPGWTKTTRTMDGGRIIPHFHGPNGTKSRSLKDAWVQHDTGGAPPQTLENGMVKTDIATSKTGQYT